MEDSLFKKLVAGLGKTKNNIINGIDYIFLGASSIDEDFYDELEEILILGDLGVETTSDILDNLKDKVRDNHIREPEECRKLLKESIVEQMSVGDVDYAFENQRSVILVVGVNGVGKTTSIGKLALQYRHMGRKVLLAAGDTFRAGAAEQLKQWADRAGVPMVGGSEGSDPASVLYDAIASYKSRRTDILICDTAGRLHNKKNLMSELNKMDKMITREDPEAHKEVLVVLDATTGQNALQQAREFNDVAAINGIILTKMDGTAKGGIAIAIQSELGIPVKYIGVGEKPEDLQKFHKESFVEALFSKVSEV